MTTTPPSVLIAAANTALRERIADAFGLDGHDVLQAATRDRAARQLTRNQPGILVVAELEHPADASRLLMDIRNGLCGDRINLAAVAIARGPGAMDRIHPLEAGADAVVAHESGYLEIRANVRAVMARTTRPATRGYRVGDLHVDPVRRNVTLRGQTVQLTPREFDLLARVASDPERVFTKHELLRDVWGFKGEGTTRTLDSHACRLRRKLESPGRPSLMQNVWGVGYRLREPITTPSAT